jgi:hypothetical protein
MHSKVEYNRDAKWAASNIVVNWKPNFLKRQATFLVQAIVLSLFLAFTYSVFCVDSDPGFSFLVQVWKIFCEVKDAEICWSFRKTHG